MEEKNVDLEPIILKIIAHSGEARSKAFSGLNEAKKGNYDLASSYLEESKESSLLAHQAQTDLLFLEAGGDTVTVNVLLVHAQDHLMSSVLAQELISEMIEMYKEMRGSK